MGLIPHHDAELPKFVFLTYILFYFKYCFVVVFLNRKKAVNDSLSIFFKTTNNIHFYHTDNFNQDF